MMGELQFIKNMKGSGCDLKEDAGLLFGSGLKKKATTRQYSRTGVRVLNPQPADCEKRVINRPNTSRSLHSW